MLAFARAAMAQNSIFRSYRLESGIFTTCLNESLDRRSDNVLITMTPDMIGPTEKFTSIEHPLPPKKQLPTALVPPPKLPRNFLQDSNRLNETTKYTVNTPQPETNPAF